jgi:Bacterial SH3 domain
MKKRILILNQSFIVTVLLTIAIAFGCKQAVKQAAKYVGVSIIDAVIQYETNSALDNLHNANKKSIYQQLIGRSAYVKTINDGFLNLKTEPDIKSMVITKMLDYEKVKILDILEKPMSIEGKRGVWCKVEYGDNIGWAWGGWLILE